MGLDSSLVIQWNGRPQRTRKPPPKTYWEEYVATDPWYVRELVADIPADEWEAAVECEDWQEGDGEDGDEDDGANTQSSDSDYSELAIAEEGDGTGTDDEGSGDDDESDVDDGATDDDASSTTDS